MDPSVPFSKVKASRAARLSAFLLPGSRKSSGAGMADNSGGGGGGGGGGAARSATHQPEGLLASEPKTLSRNTSTSSIIFSSKLSKQSNTRSPSSQHTYFSHQPAHSAKSSLNEKQQQQQSPAFRLPDWQQQIHLANNELPEVLAALPPPPTVTGDGVYFATGTPPGSPHFSANTSQYSRSAPGSPLLLPDRSSPDSLDPKNLKKRRSFLPGGARRLSKQPQEKHIGPTPKAWIVGVDNSMPEYDLSSISEGGKVLELWEEGGDALIHIFPKTSGRPPSFKLFSAIFASSTFLTELAYGKSQSKGSRSSSRIPSQELRSQHLDSSMPSLSLNDESAEDFSSLQLINLHPPLSLSAEMAFPTTRHGEPTRPTDEDLDKLIGIRNMFSFLVGQSLVATERRPSLFDVFLQVSDFLEHYDFTNIDGSTRGEVAESSFKDYVNELSLADVRSQPERAIEVLVLAERMRRTPLYMEAFVHAVGQYSWIMELVKQKDGVSTKFELLSEVTRHRMERSAHDLHNREKRVQEKLEDFAFTSMFVGLTDSKTASESKVVNFSLWKDSFQAMRKHVLSYYKHKYGSWPPKADSKKNDFETGGLNRLVLKQIYEDFAQAYDLYVDRKALTTRSSDPDWLNKADGLMDPFLVAPHALRRIFDEYDRASPPVQPAIPFDIPLLPVPNDSHEENARSGHSLDSRHLNKKLPESVIQTTLSRCLNQDVLEKVKSFPFISHLREFERKEAKGSSPIQLLSLRAGMWMFMYAVIQSLPMLVVDAPNLMYHEGCEYFLCQVPRGSIPWSATKPGQSPLIHPSGGFADSSPNFFNETNASQLGVGGRLAAKKSWYGVSGSTNMVQLPSDLVEHGVEGVYRRSHCWIMAQGWRQSLDAAAAALPKRRSVESSKHGSRQSSLEQARRGPPSSSPSLAAQSRSGSPTSSTHGLRSDTRDNVVALGLAAMPLPEGAVVPPKQRRPASRDGDRLSSPSPHHQQRSRSAGRFPSSGRIPGQASSMTFDDILGTTSQKAETGKRQRKARG